MADGTGYSNSVRAGAFLITSALVGLVVILILSKSALFTRKSDYVVRFTMEEGVAGLDAGAEVRVSGLKVGRVVRIEQRFEAEEIAVHIQMNADITLYKDAQVLRSQPLLGNYSWLNFSNLGSKAQGKLEPGQTIDAKTSGGLLATIVGPQNAGRTTEMFTNMVAFTASLDDFARVQYPKTVVPMLDDAASAVATLRKDYDGWRGDITSTLKDAALSMKKLDTSMDDAVVTVKDARATMAHFREVNIKQIDAILTDAQSGTERFASAMENLDVELTARIPDLRAMMWDLRQSATQVKLATMEVRRSPWKLLYRPSGDELARENLYESARAFAIASSDLRVAGETLRATLDDTPERFSSDPKFREVLRTQVLQSVERYEVAQKRLFDVLHADFQGQAMPTDGATVQPPMALPTEEKAAQTAAPASTPAATSNVVPANAH
ncbi:MAG: MlaD family protein [Planctomycetota bacterium]